MKNLEDALRKAPFKLSDFGSGQHAVSAALDAADAGIDVYVTSDQVALIPPDRDLRPHGIGWLIKSRTER